MNIMPHLLLATACIIWSLNFILSKTLAGVIPPYTITCLRWIIPALVYTPLAWRELREHKVFYFSRWKTLLLLVFTGYSINSFSIYLSMHYTTVINASFLASFNPVVFALLAYLLYGERVTYIQSFGIFMSIAGVVWIIFQGNPAGILELKVNPGDLLMFVSIASWALYSLIFKIKASSYPSKSLVLLLFWGGFLINVPISLVENSFSGWAWVKQVELRHLMALLGLNLFPSLLGYVCWNKAILKVPANQAAIYMNLVPVSASLISVLFLGEKLLPSTLTGGLLILTGVVLVTNSQSISKRLIGLNSSHKEAQP